MAVTTIGSYMAASEQFITLWSAVNIALGVELKLAGGYAVADLVADRAALQEAIAEATDVHRKVAMGERDMAKEAIGPRLAAFRAAVAHFLPGSAYAGSLPRAPKFKADGAEFLRPYEQMQTLWTAVNAETGVADFTPPLLLPGAYALADFTAELDALRTRYAAVNDADEAARLNRKRRDLLMEPMRRRFMQLRLAVLATFGPAHPFTLSLPRVTPHRHRKKKLPPPAPEENGGGTPMP